MSVNKVILLGYVGSDPEVRYLEKDKPVARFSLATNERQGNSDVEITEWHHIVAFNDFARIAERYIRKGSRLYIEGHLRTREYEDKFKIRRKITDIIVDSIELLGRKAD